MTVEERGMSTIMALWRDSDDHATFVYTTKRDGDMMRSREKVPHHMRAHRVGPAISCTVDRRIQNQTDHKSLTAPRQRVALLPDRISVCLRLLPPCKVPCRVGVSDAVNRLSTWTRASAG